MNLKTALCRLCLCSCWPLASPAQPLPAGEFSPERAQEAARHRVRADDELRNSPNQGAPRIYGALLEKDPIAILQTIGVTRDPFGYVLQLKVEKVLSGTVPDTISARLRWYEDESGTKHRLIDPSAEPNLGSSLLAGVKKVHGDDLFNVDYSLNLDDPEEARWLPKVEEFLRIESEADQNRDWSPYVGALLNDTWFIRDLAAWRIPVKPMLCPSPCQEQAIANIRSHLDSANPGERMLALRELGLFLSFTALGWKHPEHPVPVIRGEHMRQALEFAMRDKNTAISDAAFVWFNELVFDVKENDGYCDKINLYLKSVARVEYDHAVLDQQGPDTAHICVKSSSWFINPDRTSNPRL